MEYVLSVGGACVGPVFPIEFNY